MSHMPQILFQLPKVQPKSTNSTPISQGTNLVVHCRGDVTSKVQALEMSRMFVKKTMMYIRLYIYIWFRVPCCHPPPPHGMGPPPSPIPHTFCTRHCSETYISILLHARRCSETHIFILLDEPSRRIRWVDRAKLWRNANFKLQEWLRAVYRTLQCSANGIIYIYISMYIHIHKHQ